MSPGSESVRCPQCGALVVVSPDWRLAQCTVCGAVVNRMDFDPTYD